MQMGFYYDQQRCDGCLACVVACKEWHELPPGPVFWRRVQTFEEGEFPKVWVGHLSVSCHHCLEPACVTACPTQAISKRPQDGIVVVDREKCLPNCYACLSACPYHSPQFGDESEARMQKCDLCLDRLGQGLKPLCVSVCPVRALDAGPLEELKIAHGGVPQVPHFPDPAKTRPAILFRPRARR